MSTRIKVDINAVKIIKKKRLEENGPAQRFFTHEVRRLCDPYVPKDKGPLKNTAVEGVKTITYVQLYAKKQYYENRGQGMRGKKWEKRMMAQRGPELIRSVANFIKRGQTWTKQ